MNILYFIQIDFCFVPDFIASIMFTVSFQYPVASAAVIIFTSCISTFRMTLNDIVTDSSAASVFIIDVSL